MTRADAAWRGRWLRLALLALGFSALWLAISLFSSTSSASADEAKPSSLLGTVGSVVGGVTETTSTLGDTLGEVVGAVVEPVDTIVEPVLAPVTAVVEPVVEIVPTPVGDLVETVVPGAVGDLTTPVVDTVDQVVGSLPIVGGIVGDDTVGGIVSPVTDVVDDTLGTIIGSPVVLPDGGSGTPQVPAEPDTPDVSVDPGLTGQPADLAASGALPSDGLVADAARALGADVTRSGTSGTAAPVQPGAPPGDGPPALAPPGGGSAGSGSGATGSGAGGASVSSDAAFAALELDALASLVLHSVDDALPSSPVYDTDSTPD